MKEELLISNLIEKTCRQDPQKTAIICNNQSHSYEQLQDQSDKIAAYFQQANMQNERIAFLLPNSFELVCCYLACFKSGAIAVPLEYRDAPQEILHVFEDATPKWLIIEEDKLQDLTSLDLNKTSIERIFVHTKTHNLSHYEDFRILANHSLTLKPFLPDFSAITILLYTSGSTGLPKGVIYTYKSTAAMIKSVIDALSAINSNANFVIHDSVSHIDGLLECLPMLYVGGTIILRREFDVDQFYKDLQEFHPAIVGAHIDTLWQIIRYPLLRKADFNSIVEIFTGGEELPLTLQKEFISKTGKPILVGYGMTESIWLMITRGDNTEQRGAMGKPVNDEIKIRLLDQKGNEVVQGEVGEIWVQAPMNTLGYWNNEEATNTTIHEGWLKTGDCAKQDAAGNYWFSGRIKNIIERNSENITPFEIEQALYKHPAILQVGVIGVPDPSEGEVPIAFVSVNKKDHLSEQELFTFLQTQIAEYKIPARIFFIDKLPLTRSNKVDIKALKKLYVEMNL